MTVVSQMMLYILIVALLDTIYWTAQMVRTWRSGCSLTLVTRCLVLVALHVPIIAYIPGEILL